MLGPVGLQNWGTHELWALAGPLCVARQGLPLGVVPSEIYLQMLGCQSVLTPSGTRGLWQIWAGSGGGGGQDHVPTAMVE